MNHLKRYKNVIGKIAVIIVIFIIALIICIYAHFQMTVHQVLAESKNIELALRLLSIEYYGRDARLYDPLSPDGLAEGAAEEVRELSGADGELTLGGWDAARGAADRFTYTTGKIAVVYRYDGQEERRWKLCYQFREVAIPEYGTGG